MNLFITLDYEIYFGSEHGTVERCILEPTEELLRIAGRHGVPFIFFVDAGFLQKLDQFRKRFPVLEKDYQAVTGQLKKLSAAGHDVQLHIHPHWEDSHFDGQRWIIRVERYKLTDFNAGEIPDLVKRYKKVLQDLAANPVQVFRAGGWCLQPFAKLKEALQQSGIRADSSVFRNGHFRSAQYDYDFRSMPGKSVYRFDDDPLVEKEQGAFIEYPITSIRNSPLFFWRLFLLGRLNPARHKPLGDGRAMPAPGYRKRLLTRFTDNCLSIDGYNARLLRAELRRAERNRTGHLVVIGHPKALSRYSLEKLEAFILEAKTRHKFATFTEELAGR